MYNQRYQAEGPPPYHPSTIKQWVKRVAKFSSQYNNSSWSADQVIGSPKVYPQHGDIEGAWASAMCDKNQFIEIEFDIMVRPTAVNIYETFNPGAVTAIKAQNVLGNWVTLWSASRPIHLDESRIFSPSLHETPAKTNMLRLELDMTKAGTWCEIDAVELVGIRDGAVLPADDGAYFMDMGNLVNNKNHSDMKLQMDGKTVYGHKAILSTRSPFFLRMFDPKNKQSDLKLPDVPYTDLIAILTYIYTNRLPKESSLKTLINICKVSPLFEIPSLRVAATYKILEQLSVHNVVEIYMSLKDDPSLGELESLGKKFMADNLKAMTDSKSFQTLPQTVIVEVVQIATAKMCIDNR